MSNTTIEPLMNLIIPTVGVDPGPDYANNQNQDLLIIAGHDHSPGSGVQVTPAGMDISTNLNFQNNSLYNVYSVIFSSPAPTTGLTTLYTDNQTGGGITDLFFNDGAGNVIALTKAGAVNATIASIPGESFSGGTFTWKQGAGSTTPANFDIGSVTIRPNIASTTFGVVLGPPGSISSQYNVQLPIVPGMTSIMQLDTSGNMLATLVVDNNSLIIASQVLQVNPTFAAAQSPVGSIIMFGAAAAPSGWLLCDGSAQDRTTFANLFAVIGTNYGIGDGTTTFNIPDFRGIFPRGVDNGAGNDPDASSRTAVNGGNSGDNVGSNQFGQFTDHNHNTGGALPGGGPSEYFAQLLVQPIGPNMLIGTTTGDAGGNETRPINLYVNFIIKT